MAITNSAKTPVGICQNLINQINSVADLPVPFTKNTPVTLASIGMTANSTCKTVEELAILMTPLLMEKFRFKEDAEKELLCQGQLFFEKSGIRNDKYQRISWELMFEFGPRKIPWIPFQSTIAVPKTSWATLFSLDERKLIMSLLDVDLSNSVVNGILFIFPLGFFALSSTWTAELDDLVRLETLMPMREK